MANSILDSFAGSRASSGIMASSIQWGAFSSVGMAAGDEKVLKRLERMGLRALKPQEGMSALAQILNSACVQISSTSAVTHVDWNTFSPNMRDDANVLEYMKSTANGSTENQRIEGSSSVLTSESVKESVQYHIERIL